MAAGLATTATFALGQRVRGADTPSGPYGPFKMGLQSYTLRNFKLDEALAKTKELGLSYWESYSAHVPALTEPDKVAALQKKTGEYGVRVIGYGVIRFTKDHDANRRFFEFGKLMGLGYFSADPDPDSFDSLDKLVDEYGVAVGIHNHGPGLNGAPDHRYAKIDTIAQAIKDHSPKIGCCIDTGHFLRSREDPVRAAEVFGKRIYGVHLKDVKNATEFTVLGQGDLRTADLLKALASLKYSYCLALEYEEKPADPMDDIRTCLAEVRKAASGL
jgi:inosose dehydratase